ncbi:carbon-nitrogen hydrolase family protein [Methanosphaera cuniculi]|uniref:2-oxoglutaramate amidase n=1 Tax=Methanosphaera cuniculi TaxID=1077256 RepID=A0A2A2HCT3_9EURY|nr:carbon-nitrogen hydrolase family protein [Methanosphaera cuniculi]PAV07321.1 carbon-nitrogen hydrolase [Methanosphaera cuniculi]PWL07891.1 2-oxoglutaramate amidase [Methanosphaera cuniculi]
MQDFKIGTCQMNVVDNKNENIQHATQLIRKAAENRDVKLITLPEMFNTPYTHDKFIQNAEKQDESITVNTMCQLASELEIYLQPGSIPELSDDKIYNTAYLINPSGEIIAKHRKMHMFDINTPTMKFTESDTLSAGNNITTIKTDLGVISLAICYDVRFPELWSLMSQNKSDIILLPAAFNLTTGPLHWETLIRTRAIDTQAYVIATSPSQIENPYYIAWGHSMIVDPWGSILAGANKKEEIIYADITKDKIDSVRMQIPVLKHRRTDIYETIEK